MHIAIKASHITHGGGLTHFNQICKYFACLKPDWEFTVIAKDGQQELFWDYGNNFSIAYFTQPSKNLIAEMIWERQELPEIVNELTPDLYFVPGYHTGGKSTFPTVSLVHNIAPFAKKFVKKESFYQKFRLHMLKYLNIKSFNNSDGIIFLSGYCQRYFAQYYDSAQTKSITAYHGKPEYKTNVDENEVLKKYSINNDFLLSVSHIYEYKKIKEMVIGYLLALDKDKNIPQLIIAGTPYDEKYSESIKQTVADVGHADKVRFIGTVAEEELSALYKNCTAFIFPSWLETCSVILIEALAHGCPIICSNKTVMPEVTGRSLLYYHPHDSKKLSEHIVTLVNDTDLQNELSEKAKKAVGKYSWQSSAEKIISFFTELTNTEIKQTENKSLAGV